MEEPQYSVAANTSKTVGIVGITGRMGRQLAAALNRSVDYSAHTGFARSAKDIPDILLLPTLADLFQQNDYIVDFSNASITEDILQAALDIPKPLIICTTGWDINKIRDPLLLPLAAKVPVIIAPNTSFSTWLQTLIIQELAALLPQAYDIDIIDKHHRNKLDVPSGTAIQMVGAILKAKKQGQQVDYTSNIIDKATKSTTAHYQHGPRLEHNVMVHSLRSSQLPAEYEAIFASADDVISIKHTALNRMPFVDGALYALSWLTHNKPEPNIYTMTDVYQPYLAKLIAYLQTHTTIK